MSPELFGYRGEVQIAEERSDEGGGLRFGRGDPRLTEGSGRVGKVP
jgi:hypothetical protein